MTGYLEFHIIILTGGHHGDTIHTVGIIGIVDGITFMVGIATMDKVGEQIMLLIFTEEE